MADQKTLPCLLVYALFVATLALEISHSNAAVPAIFVFGDSNFDVGNNNFLNGTKAKVDQPFNGIDFPGGVATGRFSNGYNTLDYLAMLMGFDMSPEAFQSLVNTSSLQDQMSRGVNFASGGSGIQDHTGDTLGGAFSLKTQIENFATVCSNLTEQIGSDNTEILLSDSIFFITTGNFDFFEYYFVHGTENATLNQQFVNNLINLFKDHLQTLYQLGARKFAIAGVSAIGCSPSVRSYNNDADCSQDLNELVHNFHEATASMLDQLKIQMNGMAYSFGNTYQIMINMFNSPSHKGFAEITSGCCGSGPLNGRLLCGPNDTYCSNRDEYVFWDPYHPTQKAASLVAIALFNATTDIVAPINFQQLAQQGSQLGIRTP